MPYIGRNHIAGDHTSNFKVLDDISSYTATFDGSSALIVSTADNTIRIPEHRFIQGQRVTYTNGSSTTTITVTVGTDTVGGQSTGVFYFDGVEKPASYALKRGHTYIFDQSHSTNETYGGANHPLMVSTGSDGEHNGHGHYMTGITYKLDGATVNMMGYTSGFNAATERSMEWTVPADAPASLYYWCHHHTGQGNSYAITDGNIVGLTNGTAYFVTFDTANTFKLATSLANANNNTNINLSSVGAGSAHTLTAAFDGVNTTFKITHDGGSSANIVNSAQLQIAINNVIQKANLDSSYTEGFLVVDSRKIQFKTAPTADDIFWGNIIANTIDTFDIADLKIDQFTGDGVTTQFTLSRDVPNNQSVMVTLDGVVQHPSDKDTTRAYRILAEKVIEFSSPPPNPCDVQVRHLGFAGASTSDVSGFYGRTGNVVLGASDHITTGDITPRNINASGIVTASSFVGNLTGNVSGNLTVGGVLTYEDVTNVDSIGIITARSDIHVGAGVSAVGVGTFGSLDIGGDIDVDGHTELDNVNIAGIVTVSSDGINAGILDLKTGNNLRLRFSSGGTAQFRGDTDPIASFDRGSANSTNVKWGYLGADRGIISSTSGEFRLTASGTTPMTFHNGNSESLRIDASGDVLIGTTDDTIYNNSSGEGIVLRGGDCIDITRIGDAMLNLNRISDDGGYIVFRRDGTPKSIISTRNNSFCIDVNGTEKLRVDASGNVLIGTTDDTIYNDSSGEGIVLRGGDCIDVNRSNDSQMILNRLGSDGNHIVFRRDGVVKSEVGTITNAFYINVNSSERLRITSDGNFGTNGVTPTTQAGRVFHLHAGSAQQRFHMTNNTTGTTATDGFEIIVEESANVRIRNFEAGDMKFNTGGSDATNEVMVLKSDGSTQLRSGVLERRYESTNTAGYRYYTKAERTIAPNGGSGLNFTITGMNQGFASIRFGGYTEGNRVNFRADIGGYNAGNAGVRLYDANEITNQATSYAGGASCSITVTKNNASYVVNVTQSNVQGNGMAIFYYFETGGYNSVSTLTIS